MEQTQPKTSSDTIIQKLFEMGVIVEYKPPIEDYTPWQNRKPVKVKGAPLSQMVLNDRR
jgi:hypothetical protein